MAEKTCRAGIGLRPPPGLRWYRRPACLRTGGISDATFPHNSSDTVHDLICFILDRIFAHFASPAFTTWFRCIYFVTIYG